MKNSSPSSFDGVEREPLHLRKLDMRGFKRSDGLYEVEGHLQDTKSHPFIHPVPGRSVAEGDFVHDMGVRIIFDETMLVHDVQTYTLSAPYQPCKNGGEALSAIKGLRMAGGWSREVNARLRGATSCTHLRELLIPLATVAYQTLGFLYLQQPDRLDANGRPKAIDSCYAYAADGDVVATRWPRFHIASETLSHDE